MEDFYASIKLVTGEEILTQVLHDVEDDVIIIANAIEIEEMNVATSPGVFQCMITPHMWMKFSGEDSFILKKEHILTITELSKDGLSFYKKCLARALHPSNNPMVDNRVEADEQKGYVSSVDDARQYFEYLYRT